MVQRCIALDRRGREIGPRKDSEMFEIYYLNSMWKLLVKRQINCNSGRGVKEVKHLHFGKYNGNHIKRIWKRWFWWLAWGAVRAFEVLGRHFSSLDITNSIYNSLNSVESCNFPKAIRVLNQAEALNEVI